MIKNVVTYKNKVVLTIYHQGFMNENLTIKRCCKEYVGKSILCFKEEYVPDTEWDYLTDYAWEESALITSNEKYNPYSGNACANMIHRVCLEKPTVIWGKNNTTIEEQELEQLLIFIKKYTGMDLEEYPIYLGDIFLFSPSKFKYHTNEKKSIILYDLKEGMKVILRLKKGHNIVQSRCIDVVDDSEKLEVAIACEWDNHDIEIYKDGRLLYINRDVSYIESIHLGISVVGQKKKIPLTKLQEYYELETNGAVHTSVIGEQPEPIKQTLQEMNLSLVRKINNRKETGRFLFVRPKELKVAMNKITQSMFTAIDEIWIIDSYFTDKGSGLEQMIDWIRLTVGAKAKEKNIVFYCGNEDKALNATQLKEHIMQDTIVRAELISNPLSAINLIQTKSAIHDRFLIIRNGEEYSGLSIGTSFNSLNSNHYCIQTLVHREAKEVLDVLMAWLKENIIMQEECIYDER